MADCNFLLDGLDWDTIFQSSVLETDLPWNGGLSEPESNDAAGKTSFSSPRTGIFPSSIPSNGTKSRLAMYSEQDRDEDGTPVDSSVMIPTNTSDGSLDSSGYNQGTPVSSHHFPASEASLANSPAASLSKKKKKKRDPRLQCPNFLAGRIPCSCPEEEELEADVKVEAAVKKRSKVGARCQVPICGEDISHLKGYHQRHRVCLACANSTKVMLKDVPHRYCQQCGKFHRISDFDEGKRSCRRKLERHNILRRRRPVEEEAEAQKCEFQSLRIDVDCGNIPSEGAANENVKMAVASRGQSQGKGMVHVEQRTTGTENEDHHLTVLLHSDDLRTSDDSSGNTRSEEEIISFVNGRLNEHYLPNAVVEKDNEHLEDVSRSIKHTFKQEPSKEFYKSIGHYVSPCRSGRISFKLYDWNPADFPRRLRQQIFEWLASMPVELESYVRSGCIILTFFVTMPPLMWNQVLAEWKGQVQTLMRESGVKLLGTGQIATQMVKEGLLMKNGKVTSFHCKKLQVPLLVDLYPPSLEAGCCTQLYVFGFNFTGGRFLLSFGEQYVECSDWELVDKSHLTDQIVGNSLRNVEVHRVTVFLPDSAKFGLAYAEVENIHGLSNFRPLVVADKPVCLEINMLSFSSTVAFNLSIHAPRKELKSLRSQHDMDLLVDLGWAMKYFSKSIPTVNLEARADLTCRLQTLLFFLLEHSCHTSAQRLLRLFLCNVVSQNVQYVGCLDVWKSVNKLKYISRSKDQFVLKLPAKSDGSEIFHKEGKIELFEGPQEPKIEADQSQRNALAEGCCGSKTDTLPIELSLLEKRITVAKDGWRHKVGWAWSLSLRQKSLEPTRVSFLVSGNRRFARILLAAVGFLTVCTGMCLALQHPHEVVKISVSLRRCLWGSSSLSHV